MFKPAVIIGVMVILTAMASSAQQVFDFDHAVPKAISNARNITELAPGIKGKGLRTDGYSTYFTVRNETDNAFKSVSGWFALESFPTDTAAFFALSDSLSGQSLALCVDRFGSLLLREGKSGKDRYLPIKAQFTKFKWNHLALEIKKEKAIVFLNGKMLDEFPLTSSDPLFTKATFARDVHRKKLGQQDLTSINGLIDEIRLWPGAINWAREEKALHSFSTKLPGLAVPQMRFAGDFSRPKYHLLPAANWTNETHGLIYYSGKYHIFNQKNASNLALRQINWGHFSSPDLIHWREEKPALSPEPGYDENGIWSGHVVLDANKKPVISYTAGGAKMGIALAYPKDSGLIEWRKYENNPVIKGQPEGFTRTDLRDTYVWQENGKWYMVVGFGIEKAAGNKGTLLLYSSKDLKKWDFRHTLFEGNPPIDHSGTFWEMPIFQKIGGKYVLLVNKVMERSIPARALYWTGDFINERFVPDDPMPKHLELINRLLSPSLAMDKNNLLTTMAIIPDEIGSPAAYLQGWNHLYSLPRVWSLENGVIHQKPHPAIQGLRGAKTEVSLTHVQPDKNLKLFAGQQYEALLSISPGDAKKFGLFIHKNEDGSEFSKIYFDRQSGEIIVDQTKSSLKPGIPLNIKKELFKVEITEKMNIHLFVDGSVIEVFINNTFAFTTRIFPAKESSNIAELFTEGGSIEVQGNLWQLNPSPVMTNF